MAKKYMERIEALRRQYLATRVDMDVYNAKYVTEGFKASPGLFRKPRATSTSASGSGSTSRTTSFWWAAWASSPAAAS